MALLGGGVGGAGNPVGGSFTGPAEALELSLNYAYGYSGQVDLDNEKRLFYVLPVVIIPLLDNGRWCLIKQHLIQVKGLVIPLN